MKRLTSYELAILLRDPPTLNQRLPQISESFQPILSENSLTLRSHD